nr:hypothetical protein [uncultured Flavobacterium sp.]
MTKKRTTKKERLIERIRSIIEQDGIFTTADVMASSSPVVKTMGKNSYMLAEKFGKNGADCNIYVHDIETESDTLEYEKMTIDVLEGILLLAEKWSTINETSI